MDAKQADQILDEYIEKNIAPREYLASNTQLLAFLDRLNDGNIEPGVLAILVTGTTIGILQALHDSGDQQHKHVVKTCIDLIRIQVTSHMEHGGNLNG